jgi:hypothetical protein
VKGADGKEYTDKLYDHDMQRIYSVANPVEAVEKYRVSRIIDHRRQGEKIDFLVKFVNYKEPEWVNGDALQKDLPKMVKAYLKKMPEPEPEPKPRAKKASKTAPTEKPTNAPERVQPSRRTKKDVNYAL